MKIEVVFKNQILQDIDIFTVSLINKYQIVFISDLCCIRYLLTKYVQIVVIHSVG